MSSFPESSDGIPLPHCFEKLREGDRAPVLVVGAGLSHGLVPLPNDLLSNKKDIVEADTGCGPIDDLPEGSEALYVWADRVLKILGGHGETDPPKYRLAKSLGLLDEACWTAGVSSPLGATTPRHRVIARLARERRFSVAWSLNWDCYLENALECVGFRNGEIGQTQPWLTRYTTIVTRNEVSALSDNRIFCVLKPHGCVRSLVEAEQALEEGDDVRAHELASRFVVGWAELRNERTEPTDKVFFNQLVAHLQTAPFLVACWSVSEPYLKAVVNDALADVIRGGELQELSIVDVEFNSRGHTELAKCYRLARDEVHFSVSRDKDGFDTDALFLWLQAEYCIDRLKIASSSEIVLKGLAERETLLTPPEVDKFLVAWADVFLPAWTRLCWRAEVVPCAGFRADQLDLDQVDAHVPWAIDPLPRPDLSAAAILLTSLPIDGGKWNVEKFPGALWDDANLRMVVPVPSWGEVNDLAAFRPLAKGMDFGFVSKLEILPLNSNTPEPALPANRVLALKEQLARAISIGVFAEASSIGECTDILLHESSNYEG